MSQYKKLLEEKLVELKKYKIILRKVSSVKKLRNSIFCGKIKFYSCILSVLFLIYFGLVNSLSLYYILGISFVVSCYGISLMINILQTSSILRYDYPDLYDKNSRELLNFNNQIVVSLEKINQEILILLDDISQNKCNKFNNVSNDLKSYYIDINSDYMVYDMIYIENSKKKIKKL